MVVIKLTAHHGQWTIGRMRIGLFGGSFNPIHFGHLIAARAVAEATSIARVILLPSGRPPHKSGEGLISAGHRLAMARLAIDGESLFEVSDVDAVRAGPCYTIDTVAHFRGVYGGGTKLCWIIGLDSLAELDTWFRIGELVDACRIVTAQRPNAAVPELDAARFRKVLTDAQIARLKCDMVMTPLIDISATEIRNRIAAGRSIRYMLPDAVIDYIEGNELYR